jgi:hypothetical protein
MFVHQCTACEKRQLIFMSQVTGMTAVEGGTALAFTCWCGAEQVHSTAGTPQVASREAVAA